jgi:hypothetical protein
VLQFSTRDTSSIAGRTRTPSSRKRGANR